MKILEQLCLGKPGFANDELTAIAAREGILAAWQQAFARFGVNAAAQAGDEFAVGFTTPDQTSYLAVDRFAIRTLCYRVVDGRLRFAERADEMAGEDPELDPQAIFDYLYFHCIPSPRTIFKDVFRVPPGHYVLFERGTLSVAPYWAPHFLETSRASFAETRDEFRGTVREAVARRLDGGAVGCFLSGGTDSSTVAGMLTEVAGVPAETYSIGFDAEGYDEMEYARIASRHFKTNHHEYYVTPSDLVHSIPGVAAHYDQPFGNSSAVPAYHCALRARENGIDKMLAGDGGDELFGGNTRYAKQRVFGAYDALPTILRKRIAEPIADSGLLDHLPLVRKGASYIRQARVPMPDRMQTYNLLMRLGLGDVLTAGFLERVDTEEPMQQQRQVYAACPNASMVNRMLAFDWRYTLAENDLPKVCGTTQLAGVAVGFPLLDDRLFDFSLGLPSRYKVKGLTLRWFFKEALQGFLPDQIITKKKHGFGLPFGVWATRDAALGKLAGDSLRSIAQRGVIRPDFIKALLGTHLPAHPGYYGEMVWILMMLEQWLRAHAPNFQLK